jgi:hypothetical protein
MSLFVELLLDRSLGDRQCQLVGRELLGIATKHVAGELVEQDHAGERGQRIIEESVDRQLPLFGPQLEELLLDAVVELGRAVPPLVGAEPEPEFEDVGAPVAAHAAVPPTVRPSISKVGCPTPAGID